MTKDILAQDIGHSVFLLLPLEDVTIEVVFMEVAGEDIHRLPTPQHTVHHAAWIHPVIEHQDGLLRFEHEAAMEDICQSHSDKYLDRTALGSFDAMS